MQITVTCTWRACAVLVLALFGCSSAQTDAQDPGMESSVGGSATELPGASAGSTGGNASNSGAGGSLGTSGNAMHAGAGGTSGTGGSNFGADGGHPIFDPGPDDPLPPDPGVTMPFVHSLFTDHMVLQRDAMTPVWGWSQPGDKVTVQIAMKTFTATADQYGRWLVRMTPFSAGGPWTLAISGPKSVTIQDVFFGDVWLCSGQSNMVLPVNAVTNGAAEIAASSIPQLRHFTVFEHAQKAPRQSLSGNSSWTVAGPTTTSNLSATCYFFGRSLQEKLKIPVGLIVAAVGGTWVEAWTAGPALAAIEDFKPAVAALPTAADPVSNNTVSVLFNGLIAPLLPYGIKGAAWYQGESNADNNTNHASPDQYSWVLPTLIADWRTRFKMGKFPFLIVQLPNNSAPQTLPSEDGSYWALLREAQLNTAINDPGNGLAVTADIGDAMDLHPHDKQDVGARLASSAFHVAYGEANEFSAPTPSGATVEGGRMRVTFANADSGVMVGTKVGLNPVQEIANGVLTGFAIAGADKKFVWATATIDGHTVVVSSPQVPSPVAVRYGWGSNPPCNLYNKRGLLASPFRTDPLFRLNVVRGNGAGAFAAGTSMAVSASAPPVGMHFDKWSGDVQYLADPKSASTIVKMPRQYVSIAAWYLN
jgi:sialate O-acetylesterase